MQWRLEKLKNRRKSSITQANKIYGELQPQAMFWYFFCWKLECNYHLRHKAAYINIYIYCHREQISSTLSDPPMGFGLWCHFFKKNTDAVRRLRHQPTSIKAVRFGQKKKMERHTQSLGKGPAFFSPPENRRTVKKVNQRFFKDGGVGGTAKKRP